MRKRGCQCLRAPCRPGQKAARHLFQKSGVSSIESFTRLMPKNWKGQRDLAHWLQLDRSSSGAHCHVETATPFLNTSMSRPISRDHNPVDSASQPRQCLRSDRNVGQSHTSIDKSNDCKTHAKSNSHHCLASLTQLAASCD